MKICVSGWYFDDGLMNVIDDIPYSVVMVCHRSNKILDLIKTKNVIIPNIGLEFGSYDFYLKNLWDGDSDVLFMHDDVNITDLSVFDKINDLDNVDQAYIFKNYKEQKNNGGKHGRAIFVSAKLLKFMLDYECDCYQCLDHTDGYGHAIKASNQHNGFWFDIKNTGHTTGKPPAGVRHYNAMIEHFHRYMGWIRDQKLGNPKMNVLNRIHLPAFDCARRGEFRIER